MVASDSFAEFLREQLAPLGRISLRRMFGKTGVFCDGVMLGMVTDNMLYLRVDDGNREAFEEARSSPPLNYAKGGKHHRPLLLACAGAAVRRTRRACRLGAAGAGCGAPGRVQARTADAHRSGPGTPDDPSSGPSGSQVLENW